MELGTYLLAVRRRSALVALVILAALCAATVLFILRPVDYQSTARLFVRVDIATNGTDLAQGTTYTQLVAKSFATVSSSPFVLEPVSRGSGGRYSVTDLASRIDVEVEPSTSIIDLTVRLPDPADARKYADTIAGQSVDAIGALIPTSAGGAPIATITSVQPATRAQLVDPNALLQYLAAGAGAGVVLAVALALLLERLQRRIRDGADVRHETDVPFLGTFGAGSGRDERRLSVLTVTEPSSGLQAVTALATLPQRDARARVVALVDAAPGGSPDAAALLLESAVQLGLSAQLYDLTSVPGQEPPTRQGRRAANTGTIDLRADMRSIIGAARPYNDMIFVRADRTSRTIYEMLVAREVDATLVVVGLGRTSRRDLADALDLASSFASPELFMVPFRDTRTAPKQRPKPKPAGRSGLPPQQKSIGRS
ncbi:YveK family protein [uncultured Amnibacterium sp.]|uniref:YveK family protein n=1 Tax=uncultured Amnibacterium sp. TaxID=1631851 RepID=UPI0035CABC16